MDFRFWAVGKRARISCSVQHQLTSLSVLQAPAPPFSTAIQALPWALQPSRPGPGVQLAVGVVPVVPGSVVVGSVPVAPVVSVPVVPTLPTVVGVQLPLAPT